MWLTHFWHSWSQFFIFAWDVTAGGILRTGVLICLVFTWWKPFINSVVYVPMRTLLNSAPTDILVVDCSNRASWESNGTSAWVSNFIRRLLLDAIAYPRLDFNGVLTKPQMKLWHGWVIIFHRNLLMWSLIHIVRSIQDLNNLYQGPLLLTWIATRISNYMSSEVWDESHPFLNFNGYTVEVW